MSDDLTPDSLKELERRQREIFAKNLYQAMIRKGWTQAELGRRAGLERYNISNYARGTGMPSSLNLEKIAKALDMKPDDLMPPAATVAQAPATPSSMVMVGDGKVRIRADAVVSVDTGAQIIQLINNDGKTSNGR